MSLWYQKEYKSGLCLNPLLLYPGIRSIYKVYIVFVFSVTMPVCLLTFFCQLLDLRILKFDTKLGYDKLYCLLKIKPHIPYQFLYLSIFLFL